LIATAGDPVRARYPDAHGYVERDGVRVYYEVHGEGERTLLLLPTWAIVHSRLWKMQVPYLSRHCRVIVFDPRGNGRSDRPADPPAYREQEYALDAVAVLDATDTTRACVAGHSMGAQRALVLAAQHGDRVDGAVFICPAVPLTVGPTAIARDFDAQHERHQGWAKYNRHHWLSDYGDFLEFFFGQVFTEPHSQKQIEDCVGWAHETNPETLVATEDAPPLDGQAIRALAAQVSCPVLIVHGDADAVRPPAEAAELARITGGALVTIAGGGHAPHARDPVRTNLLLKEFVMRPRGGRR
jgi:pimeloyl-ACP methyl ester carboxylesterase